MPYAVVEKAGMPGERTIVTMPTKREAQNWMIEAFFDRYWEAEERNIAIVQIDDRNQLSLVDWYGWAKAYHRR